MAKIKDKVIKLGKIKWKGTTWFQGELKEMSVTNLKKLKQSIIKHDFADPLKIWNDGEKDNILDGHGRKLALEDLEKDGVEVPKELPAIWIDCKDKKEAAELVLAYNSQYGKVSHETLYKFHHDMNLDMGSIENIDIPSINIDLFKDMYLDGDGTLNVPIAPSFDNNKNVKIKIEIPINIYEKLEKSILKDITECITKYKGKVC